MSLEQAIGGWVSIEATLEWSMIACPVWESGKCLYTPLLCCLALKGNREVGRLLEGELEFLTLTFKMKDI